MWNENYWHVNYWHTDYWAEDATEATFGSIVRGLVGIFVRGINDGIV